jgi:alkanesulfonate monooxygenase SsuD/methylene tetrahydromethanopterin reductase-like flavin-dependent oxidoreductase (luciferase family)
LLDRVGRIADGWLPPVHATPGRLARECWDRILTSADRSGRDPDELTIEPRVYVASMSDDQVVDVVGVWAELGARRVCLDTRYGAEPAPIAAHAERLLATSDLLGHVLVPLGPGTGASP